MNSALTTLYWYVGRGVRMDIRKEKRAEYGEWNAHALSAQLAVELAHRTVLGWGESGGTNRSGLISNHPEPTTLAGSRTTSGALPVLPDGYPA